MKKHKPLDERDGLFLRLNMIVFINRCDGLSTDTMRKMVELAEADLEKIYGASK